MNKMQMAHDMALELVKIKPSLSAWQIADRCFEYADAMQAEADKRKKAKAAKKSKGIREILENHEHTFIDGCVCWCGKIKSDFDKEWQPDWSQAPEWANWWATCSRGQTCWYGGEPVRSENGWGIKYDGYPFHTAPSFNYQGNWQDSLRKRPQ